MSHSILAAALRAMTKLEENKHLLAALPKKFKGTRVPEACLGPLEKFLADFATTRAIARELRLREVEARKFFGRTQTGDLKKHALRQGQITFVRRAALAQEPRGSARKLPGFLRGKHELAPDVFEKAYPPVDKYEFNKLVLTKLGAKKFEGTLAHIQKLIDEAGGFDTKFAHALHAAAISLKPVELHNSVTMAIQLPLAVRRGLFETLLQIRGKRFKARLHVPGDDPVRQAAELAARMKPRK